MNLGFCPWTSLTQCHRPSHLCLLVPGYFADVGELTKVGTHIKENSIGSFRKAVDDSVRLRGFLLQLCPEGCARTPQAQLQLVARCITREGHHNGAPAATPTTLPSLSTRTSLKTLGLPVLPMKMNGPGSLHGPNGQYGMPMKNGNSMTQAIYGRVALDDIWVQ